MSTHELRQPRVMLDPGHGGRDPGAVGLGGLQEKAVVLAVTQLAAERFLLRSEAPFEVRLTRTTDVRLGMTQAADLWNRAKLANRWPADLFISIHCNAGPTGNRTAHGTEVFVHPTAGEQARGLAAALQRSLVAALGTRDRGVKEANFGVLRHARMPAVLVELAFISNPREEAMLGSAQGQGRAALAIVEGVARHWTTRSG